MQFFFNDLVLIQLLIKKKLTNEKIIITNFRFIF